ncbi:MAG: DUF2249 domain-containing protein [Chloroflexi bacterium]|nr:DUF2249 domain-containing protein [Chloroflexota bacterium]
MKIAEVLKEYPSLLEVLVAQSPHFTRLKNPILRRIHSRLVTVAQAAAIAGLDPAALVRTLNAAAGVVEEKPEAASFRLSSMAGTPEPPWVSTSPIAVRLDVREDQRNHSDPFSRIMAAVSEVQDGQVFYLKNTFEPLPLYDVLGKRGFVAWACRLGPEEWEVYFLKQGRVEATAADRQRAGSEVKTASEIDDATPTATVSIDVKELTPPQPMIKILDALASLESGETLLVHHKRRPAYLYPKLAELGYANKTVELGPDEVDIYIRKS